MEKPRKINPTKITRSTVYAFSLIDLLFLKVYIFVDRQLGPEGWGGGGGGGGGATRLGPG